MPVSSFITEMDLQASESLLEDFKRRSRRFRRRVRQQGHPAAAPPVVDPVVLAEQLNQAAQLDEDDVDDDVPAGGAAGPEADSDSWTHERIDQGREQVRLEKILLKENEEFRLHC